LQAVPPFTWLTGWSLGLCQMNTAFRIFPNSRAEFRPEGGNPERSVHLAARKDSSFSEEKEAKRLFPHARQAKAGKFVAASLWRKVFWFFFSKKNR